VTSSPGRPVQDVGVAGVPPGPGRVDGAEQNQRLVGAGGARLGGPAVREDGEDGLAHRGRVVVDQPVGQARRGAMPAAAMVPWLPTTAEDSGSPIEARSGKLTVRHVRRRALVQLEHLQLQPQDRRVDKEYGDDDCDVPAVGELASVGAVAERKDEDGQQGRSSRFRGSHDPASARPRTTTNVLPCPVGFSSALIYCDLQECPPKGPGL
jgi:hypothetical protein